MSLRMKPTIYSNDPELLHIVAEAWDALKGRRPPAVFRRGTELVRVATSTEGGQIQSLTIKRLAYELNRAADWMKQGEEKDLPSRAPTRVLEDMLAHPNPPLPELIRLVQMPVFSKAGELIARPGYHEESGIFVAPPDGLKKWLEHIQEINAPAPNEINAAVNLIDEMFCDFPFAGEADRAHAFALLLLPLVRELISSPTPLHLIHKPTPGTGGTLLAKVINLAVTGSDLDVMALSKWEEERHRALSAALSTGRTYQVFDNIHSIDSPAVASAITSDKWSDRKIGSSEAPSTYIRCGWIATGNNPTLSPEITRRTVSIYLDAHTERPEMRSGFRHADLPSFVKANRLRIFEALVVLVQGWQAAGKPLGNKTLGMFESWAQVVGGILDVAGVRGFLNNLEALHDAANIQTTNWAEFYSRWQQKFGLRPVGVADLWELLDDPEPVDLDIDRAKDTASQKTTLGQQLVTRRGTVIGAYRLADAGLRHRAKQWRLELVHERGDRVDEPSDSRLTRAKGKTSQRLEASV